MKKKILFVNGHLNVGGVEKSLTDVLKNFNYSLYEVDLVLFEDLGDYAVEVPKEVNIIYYDLTKTYGSFKQCILKSIKSRDWFTLILKVILLLNEILGSKVLVLAKPLFMLNTYYECAIAYRPGICTDFVGYVVKSKKKVTWWHHGVFDYPDKVRRQLFKIYKKFHNIIAVSDSCKEMLLKTIPEINNKLVTISNMINVNEIKYKANDDLYCNINCNGSIVILSIGRLSPEKGMINCVYTCKALIDNGYDVKWYLIGDGAQREEIQKSIKQYHLENNIHLLGAISNPYPYIKKAHIYVHPSLVESLSITVLEALALNIPAVVARSMGPTEFIQNKVNGLLVKPTPEGLYEGIVCLINNKILYNQIKNYNNEILKNYSPEIVMKKIESILN